MLNVAARHRSRRCARMLNGTQPSLARLSRRISYSSKVRAYPFAVDPEEAKTKMMNRLARHTVLNWDFWGSFFDRAKIDALTDQPEPLKLQAFYIPVWFVDAEVEGVVRTHGASAFGGNKPCPETAHFYNAFMPGLAMDPLSRISFREVAMRPWPIPWSNHLRDHDAICLQHSTSPFQILDKLNSRSRPLSVTSSDDPEEGRRYDILNSKPLQTRMLAAYPVLLPMYIAQFPSVGPNVENVLRKKLPQVKSSGGVPPGPRLTMIMEAWLDGIPGGRVMLLDPFPGGYNKWHSDLVTSLASSTPTKPPLDPVRPEIHMLEGAETFFTDITVPGLAGHNFAGELERWIERLMDEEGAMSNLIESASPPDMEDPRIRPYSESEIVPVRDWMAIGRELTSMKAMVQNFSGSNSNVKVVRVEIGRKRKGKPEAEEGGKRSAGPISIESQAGDEFAASMRWAIEDLERRRRETKPQWWREWEENQEGNQSESSDIQN